MGNQLSGYLHHQPRLLCAEVLHTDMDEETSSCEGHTTIAKGSGCVPNHATQQGLKIHITGIHNHEIKQSLIKNIHLSHFRDFDIARKNQIRRTLKKAESDIKILLQPYGYYKPIINYKQFGIAYSLF